MKKSEIKEMMEYAKKKKFVTQEALKMAPQILEKFINFKCTGDCKNCPMAIYEGRA